MIGRATNVGSLVIDINGDGRRFTASTSVADAQAGRTGVSLQTAARFAISQCRRGAALPE